MEGDNWKICSSVCGNKNFYPRPPGGGRHFAYCRQWHVTWYFYPRPPGGGRLSLYRYHQKFLKISIHALRVEGDDTCSTPPTKRSLNFYPRPPGGGRRFADHLKADILVISIHALRVEGDNAQMHNTSSGKYISIHALRVEGDNLTPPVMCDLLYFYPRPPGGGRPDRGAGVDCHKGHFYPRPPGGGRPALKIVEFVQSVFLSTPSGWRATQPTPAQLQARAISIHALRVEGDSCKLDAAFSALISIHALRVEGDSKNRQSFHLFLRKREKNLPL